MYMLLCQNEFIMIKVRTTLRIEKHLKEEAEKKAIELNTTLQEIFNTALENYLNNLDKKKAKRIVFFDKAIDKRLDNLTRDDYYD